ncbi:MAG: hypothetical protein HY908_35315 [Myxococcales bacterium]|nr:hypothetical protein [Myxococcales bacterium]
MATVFGAAAGRAARPALRLCIALLSLLVGETTARADAPEKLATAHVNPCNTPDPGWGVYDEWQRLPTVGWVAAPSRGGARATGEFDLLVHFHGKEAARKEFVKIARGIVLVGVDLGVGSAPYSSRFADPRAFTTLVADVETLMSGRIGRPARARNVGLSAWSAGYGAIARVLAQPAGDRVDAIVLLDSLYASYADRSTRTVDTEQLAPWLAFAERAAAGRRFLFESFSAIEPETYASTGEVARYLVGAVGASLRPVERGHAYGFELRERLDQGAYHVRGYAGRDEAAHCAHLGMLPTVLKKYLHPRWHPPAVPRS